VKWPIRGGNAAFVPHPVPNSNPSRGFETLKNRFGSLKNCFETLKNRFGSLKNRLGSFVLEA
jgi:hypothetical protein